MKNGKWKDEDQSLVSGVDMSEHTLPLASHPSSNQEIEHFIKWDFPTSEPPVRNILIGSNCSGCLHFEFCTNLLAQIQN